MTSPDFWAILRILAGNADSAPIVFDILESGADGSSTAIIADNYEAAITLLNQFASAASVGALVEQKVDRRQQRKTRQRPVKPEGNGFV